MYVDQYVATEQVSSRRSTSGFYSDSLFAVIQCLKNLVLYTYTGVKEMGFQALRGYNTHLNKQKSLSQHMSRNQWLLRYGRVNVWVDFSGDQLLKSVVLPNALTGAVSHRFLVNDLPVPLEYVPLHQRQHMWFTHDGAPPHFLRTVREHLNQTFGEQWIRCGGPINWPPRSPDLKPLDFWLWGYL
jgi:hypothetical protein